MITKESAERGSKVTAEPEAKQVEIWWKVIRSSSDPVRCEFVGSTSEMLILANGRREKKHTEYASYFPTKEAALADIRQRLEANIRSAESRLKSAQEELTKFEKKHPRP